MIKTNQLHTNSQMTLTGKQGATGYYVSFNNFVQQGAVKYQHGYDRQTARANIDQQIGSDLTFAMQTMFTRSVIYPDNLSWFGLTREHAAANLTQIDAKGRLVYRPDITAETSQDGNNNPLYFASYPYGRTDANRFLGSLTSHYNATDWLFFESTTSIDERKSTGVGLIDKGYRRTAPSPASDGSMSASSSNNLAYNILLDATAKHDFSRDLTSRFDLRYTYEDQESNGVDASGNTLTLPGLLDLGNATTSLSPGYSQSSQRAIAGSIAANLGFKDRYFYDGSIRKDGSSLFGADQRYHNYYRSSVAWVLSDEPFFSRASDIFDSFKLRAAVGTAGGRPRFSAQYESLSLGTGGSITANTLGNKDLRPETTLETEYGVDMELWHRYGVQLTYARDITTDQILQVPPSVSSGFSSQWKNAGTMDGRTWEASINIPVVMRKNFNYSSRVNWDQTRSYITKMDVPDFFSGSIRYAVGERYGNVYGKKFVTQCSQLPSDFAARCGNTKDFDWQPNDQGYIVWVGKGNTYKEGVTKNLWQAQMGGCVVGGVERTNITGVNNCLAAGGTTNTPWGQPILNWGMVQAIRDSTGSEALQLLGNSQPLWKIGWSHNLQYKRLSVYGLVDKVFGNKIYNEDRHWSWEIG